MLAGIFSSARVLPATVSFVDIAGIVRGASEGAGLGNKFLANIREADAICQVIRAFTDPDVVHVDGKVSPADDIETINTELILADLQTLEKALPRLEKEARIAKDKQPVLAAVKQAQEVLDSGRTVFAAGLDLQPLRELHLMTAKPFLYVFNVDPGELANADFLTSLRELVAPAEAVFLDAKTEAELVELEPDEALELLQSMGVEESGLNQLARLGFDTLGLQTYLTAGPKESRAWTIPQGATAPQAAGVIHTDFERGFIKAEVVSYDELVAAGSMAEAKARGKVRIEGKDYVMADGDVVEFRFNVWTRRSCAGHSALWLWLAQRRAWDHQAIERRIASRASSVSSTVSNPWWLPGTSITSTARCSAAHRSSSSVLAVAIHSKSCSGLTSRRGMSLSSAVRVARGRAGSSKPG